MSFKWGSLSVNAVMCTLKSVHAFGLCRYCAHAFDTNIFRDRGHTRQSLPNLRAPHPAYKSREVQHARRAGTFDKFKEYPFVSRANPFSKVEPGILLSGV